MSYTEPAFDADFFVEVKKGNIEHSLVHKFGRNDAVPNGSWAFVNLLGFTAWPLSAATTVRVKSGGNAADSSTGAGARQIIVQGIDSSLDEVTEQMATAGASASAATTASFWRIHRAWVHEAGTYGGSNSGDIVIENSSGGTDLLQIETGEGQSQFAGFSIADGKTAYLLSLDVTVDGGKPADIRMMTREDLNDASGAVKATRIKKSFNGVLGTLVYTPRAPDVTLNALTDIWIEARGDGNATSVSALFELLIIDD